MKLSLRIRKRTFNTDLKPLGNSPFFMWLSTFTLRRSVELGAKLSTKTLGWVSSTQALWVNLRMSEFGNIYLPTFLPFL